MTFKIAIVGCGFVADYYMQTFSLHPTLRVVGVTDRDPERAARFAAFHSTRREYMEVLRYVPRPVFQSTLC